MNMKLIVHAAAEYCIQGDAPPPFFSSPFLPLLLQIKDWAFNWFLLVNSRLMEMEIEERNTWVKNSPICSCIQKLLVIPPSQEMWSAYPPFMD